MINIEKDIIIIYLKFKNRYLLDIIYIFKIYLLFQKY